jgi:hypothetical protein
MFVERVATKESLFARPGRGRKSTGGGGSVRGASVIHTQFRESMKPLCDLCGSRHESYQGHVFASNRIASNKHAREQPALSNQRGDSAVSGTSPVGSREVRGERVEIPIPADVCGRDEKAKKQRWHRDAYNAYQREYMRKRRGRDLA